MNEAKHLIGPAVLAVAGVEGSKLLGLAKPWHQVIAAIGGAMLGLAISKRLGKSAPAGA